MPKRCKGLAELGEVLAVHLATRFRRMPVMAAPVRIEAEKSPSGCNHFLHPQEAAHRPLPTKNIE